jgi:hypothetical protein
MLALIAVDLWRPESAAAGALALATAIIQGMRLAQWGTWRTLRLPIVWVLHLAYLWLPLGLALKAFAFLGKFAFVSPSRTYHRRGRHDDPRRDDSSLARTHRSSPHHLAAYGVRVRVACRRGSSARLRSRGTRMQPHSGRLRSRFS